MIAESARFHRTTGDVLGTTDAGCAACARGGIPVIAAIAARRSIHARRNSTGSMTSTRAVARLVDRARTYAARHGSTVLPEYVVDDDGISGAESERRPGRSLSRRARSRGRPSAC